MLLIKNLMSYQFTKSISTNHSSLEDALQTFKFIPCSPRDMSSIGFVPFLSDSNTLVHKIQEHHLFLVCQEKRILPPEVINRELNIRIKKIEENSGRKITKNEKIDLKNSVILELLPKAFSKIRYIPIWFDTYRNMLHIDASNSKTAELVLAVLRKALGSLPVVPVKYNKEPTYVMTEWLKGSNLPVNFPSILEIKLKDYTDESEAIFKKQEINSDEIQECLSSGKLVTKVKLEFQDTLTLSISTDGTISSIKHNKIWVEENIETLKNEKEAYFNAYLILIIQELNKLLDSLQSAFDGIKAIDIESN